MLSLPSFPPHPIPCLLFSVNTQWRQATLPKKQQKISHMNRHRHTLIQGLPHTFPLKDTHSLTHRATHSLLHTLLPSHRYRYTYSHIHTHTYTHTCTNNTCNNTKLETISCKQKASEEKITYANRHYETKNQIRNPHPVQRGKQTNKQSPTILLI